VCLLHVMTPSDPASYPKRVDYCHRVSCEFLLLPCVISNAVCMRPRGQQPCYMDHSRFRNDLDIPENV
jgi:hypothetical protein